MRKICFSLVVLSMILLMVNLSFAQGSRGATRSEGKTGFTNIAVVGLNNDGDHAIKNPGTPGYIEMINGAGDRYYLYISYDGNLLIASDVAVGWQASPAIVDWGGKSASGVVVGSQS